MLYELLLRQGYVVLPRVGFAKHATANERITRQWMMAELLDRVFKQLVHHHYKDYRFEQIYDSFSKGSQPRPLRRSPHPSDVLFSSWLNLGKQTSYVGVGSRMVGVPPGAIIVVRAGLEFRTPHTIVGIFSAMASDPGRQASTRFVCNNTFILYQGRAENVFSQHAMDAFAPW